LRLVVDTNLFMSALLSKKSLPAHVITLWREGRFDRLTFAEQLDELRRATRCYPKIRAGVDPHRAGRLINQLRDIAIMVEHLPAVAVCANPDDNFVLAMAHAGAADFLLTGDERDLLVPGTYEHVGIISVRDFLAVAQWRP
jgi:putative PIN family toxin of toxin-antitoxin system